MNYRLINRICYSGAIASILAGMLIGLLAIWADTLLSPEFTSKSLATTILLFASSALGSWVTRLLVVPEPTPNPLTEMRE